MIRRSILVLALVGPLLTTGHSAAGPSDDALIAFVRGESFSSVIHTVYPDGSGDQEQDPAPGFGGSFMHSPDWDPTGRLLAFGTAYNNDIYIMDVSGEEPTLLRQLNTGGDNPRWSSDASLITFDRQTENTGGGGTGSQIFVTNAGDGSGTMQLTAGSGANYDVVGAVHSQQAYTPDFSTDGSTIFFGRQFITVACCTPTGLNYGETTYQLAAIPVGGGELTILEQSPDGNFSNADVSADGRSLAYDHFDGETRWIYIRDLVSGDVERLVQGTDPSFSPAGSRIAYTSGLDVMAIDLRDGQIVNVTEPTGQCRGNFFCGSAAWQPRDVPTEYERKISLDGSATGVSGKVNSDAGKCIKAVTVKIQRKKPSGWSKVSSTVTDIKGRFEAAIDRPGKYRAVTPEVTKSSDVCLKAVSNIKKLAT